MTEENLQQTDTEAEAVVQQAYADLGQHGHAAAKLGNPEHVNPHDEAEAEAEADFEDVCRQEQEEQQALDDLDHDTTD